MSALVILLLVSVFIASCFLVIFIIAVWRGQYKDTYTPSIRMLFEEKEKDEGMRG